MNIITLLKDYRSLILEDAKIKAWCQFNYNKSVTAYIGIDKRNPPAEADYPLVHLFPGGKEVGPEVDPKPHIIGCTCGVHNSNEAEEVFDNGKIMEGVVHLEEFRQLVQDAIVTSDLDEVYVSRIQVDYETVEFYPFHLVMMEITVKQPGEFRADPFD